MLFHDEWAICGAGDADRRGGRVDLTTYDRLVEFLLAAGVDGVVAGGATGEYPHFQMRERAELVRRAAGRLPRNRRLVAGIGGASMRRVVKLGRMAIDAGAEARLRIREPRGSTPWLQTIC